MRMPILARQDEALFEQYRQALPQSLIVAGEAGLDRKAAVDCLAQEKPSDVNVITPEEDKKNISVEQIRNMIASLRTYVSHRRVIIIRLAEDMTEVAQNALLKALEEPSQGTFFIIESEQPSSLLPTILSRCQIFTLHRTSVLQDNSLLKGSGLDATAKQQIRFLAAGRPELIREYIEVPKKLIEQREVIADAKKILSSPSSYEALLVIKSHDTSRIQALKFIDVVITLIRFQMKSRGPQASILSLLERAERAEAGLHSNGNIKLSLMQLIA